MSDRIVRLPLSDDGGEKWSEWEEESIGVVWTPRNATSAATLAVYRSGQ